VEPFEPLEMPEPKPEPPETDDDDDVVADDGLD
jgi:hypothetical protein